MKRSAVACIAISLGVATFAQTPPPAGQTPPPVAQTPPPVIDQPSPPQFRTSIELVRLDVSVLDKKRRPVRGLSPADFTVLENGVEQAIAAFTPVELPDVAPDPMGAPWLKTVASDVGGNVDMQQRRLLILAIDDATIENDVKAIKSVKEIAHSVVNRLGPTDLMSVVFTRDNRGSQDFTSDRARLNRAIETFTVGSRGMGGGPGSPGAQMDELWYLYSVGMMDRAVDFLADVPDRRKAIIYVGQGLPFSLETAVTPINANIDRAQNLDSAGDLATQQMQMRVRDQMTDVFERANRANVNVYTVDPCGLRVGASTPPPSGNARNNITPSPPPCQPGLEIDYLVQMAAATGGRPIVNTSDFGPGLDAAFAENASYYLLGYQSTDQARDGKFRKLEVRVNRPDLEVRTRTGYDAPREESLTRPKPQVSPLGKAMSGVVPRGDFPMQITAAPFAIAEKGMPPTTVAIVVGFKQPIRESLERTVENVDLQISAYDADGRSYGTSRSRADVAIRAGATGSAEYRGVRPHQPQAGPLPASRRGVSGELRHGGQRLFRRGRPGFFGAAAVDERTPRQRHAEPDLRAQGWLENDRARHSHDAARVRADVHSIGVHAVVSGRQDQAGRHSRAPDDSRLGRQGRRRSAAGRPRGQVRCGPRRRSAIQCARGGPAVGPLSPHGRSRIGSDCRPPRQPLPDCEIAVGRRTEEIVKDVKQQIRGSKSNEP